MRTLDLVFKAILKYKNHTSITAMKKYQKTQNLLFKNLTMKKL